MYLTSVLISVKRVIFGERAFIRGYWATTVSWFNNEFMDEIYAIH